MSSPTPALLAAKFHRPAAPRHAVPRPALMARLNDGLARQPAEIQEFLLQTSILGQFCAELCDAGMTDGRPATGDERTLSSVIRPSATALTHLERANVFLIVHSSDYAHLHSPPIALYHSRQTT